MELQKIMSNMERKTESAESAEIHRLLSDFLAEGIRFYDTLPDMPLKQLPTEKKLFIFISNGHSR